MLLVPHVEASQSVVGAVDLDASTCRALKTQEVLRVGVNFLCFD